MTNAQAVRSLFNISKGYDAIPAYMADLGKAGHTNTPEFQQLVEAHNWIGDVLVRLRDAVATVIVRNANGPGLWKSIAAKIPSIQYNLNESLGGTLDRSFRDRPQAMMPDRPLQTPVQFLMNRSFIDWTDPEAATIAGALPAHFEEWALEVVAALQFCMFLVNSLFAGPESRRTPGVASSLSTSTGDASPGRAFAGVLVAVMAGVFLWSFNRRNSRRKS